MTPASPIGNDLRIAVAFFGITRALGVTIGSIRENIVAPARSVTPEVRLFGHLYAQDRIDNPRSHEAGQLDPEEYRLLELDEIEREAPGLCLAEHDFEGLKAFDDPWKDGFVSVRNLVHQLHSLRRVTLMALAWNPDVVIFARPDLYYHGPVTPWLNALAETRDDCAMVPDWSNWDGFNDRFAIVRGAGAIRAYGTRIDRLIEYCRRGKRPHAEKFLKFALAEISVQEIPLHGSRVRSNGMVVVEDFTPGRGGRGRRGTIPTAAFLQARGVVGQVPMGVEE